MSLSRVIVLFFIIIFLAAFALWQNVSLELATEKAKAFYQSGALIAERVRSLPPADNYRQLTPAQHLVLGKAAIAFGEIEEAIKHLKAIPRRAKEYAEAQRLLYQLEDWQQIGETVDKIAPFCEGPFRLAC